MGFLGGLEDDSGGCLVALGPLSFFPFFPLSLAFPGGAVQDADSGKINEEPPLCPMCPPHPRQGAYNLGRGAAVSPAFPRWGKLRGEATCSHGRAGTGFPSPPHLGLGSSASQGVGPRPPICRNLQRSTSQSPLSPYSPLASQGPLFCAGHRRGRGVTKPSGPGESAQSKGGGSLIPANCHTK